jgi:hypothetical protein
MKRVGEGRWHIAVYSFLLRIRSHDLFKGTEPTTLSGGIHNDESGLV